MSSEETQQLTPLEELAFAPADHPWDEQAARERLREALGWAALAAYSLAIDPTADAESFDAYKLLVVDMVDGKPLIIPAALTAARKSLDDLEGQMRDAAESKLAILEEKLARETEVSDERIAQEAESPAVQEPEEVESEESEPQKKEEYSCGLEQAEGIVERLAAEGKLLPAWSQEELVQFVAALSTEKILQTREGEFSSPVEYFVIFIESLPALVPTQEYAAPAARQDRSYESLGHKIAQTVKQKANQ